MFQDYPHRRRNRGEVERDPGLRSRLIQTSLATRDILRFPAVHQGVYQPTGYPGSRALRRSG